MLRWLCTFREDLRPPRRLIRRGRALDSGRSRRGDAHDVDEAEEVDAVHGLWNPAFDDVR